LYGERLTKEDLLDIIAGASIFSTGGGGSLQGAKHSISEIVEKGWEARVVHPRDVGDDNLVVMPADVGGGVEKEEEERFEKIYGTRIPLKWDKWPWDQWSPTSTIKLQELLKKDISAFLAGETGPGALMNPLMIACKFKKAVLDADTAGRAVPELTMSKLNLEGCSIGISVSTTHFGDIIVIKKTASYRRLEDIVRAVAAVSGGGVGLATAYKMLQIRRGLVEETYSRCKFVGKAIREAKEKAKDVVDSIIEATGGFLLFRGTISSVEKKPVKGYLIGEICLTDGRNEFKIWFKNENHITWLNGKPFATSPDIITIIDSKTGEGLWNWDPYPRDRELVVIGIPAQQFWRDEKGLRVLGPTAFGFEIEYKPIEFFFKGSST
jgi:DUF917 family protein